MDITKEEAAEFLRLKKLADGVMSPTPATGSPAAICNRLLTALAVAEDDAELAIRHSPHHREFVLNSVQNALKICRELEAALRQENSPAQGRSASPGAQG